MSGELVTQGHFAPKSMEDMLQLARMVASSGLAPSTLKSPEAVLVAMQHGMELGLSPMQAVQSVAVINGRPSIWGDAALALAMSHPDFEDIEETFERGKTEDELLARCEVKRKGRSPVIRTFSVADAKRAKLWREKPTFTKRGQGGSTYEADSGPWWSYPKRMLQMRARSFAIRDAFPDALKGVSIVEEMRDVTPREPRKESPKMILPDETTPPPALEAGEAVAEVAQAVAEAAEPKHEPAEQDGDIADHDLFE